MSYRIEQESDQSYLKEKDRKPITLRASNQLSVSVEVVTVGSGTSEDPYRLALVRKDTKNYD